MTDWLARLRGRSVALNLTHTSVAGRDREIPWLRRGLIVLALVLVGTAYGVKAKRPDSAASETAADLALALAGPLLVLWGTLQFGGTLPVIRAVQDQAHRNEWGPLRGPAESAINQILFIKLLPMTMLANECGLTSRLYIPEVIDRCTRFLQDHDDLATGEVEPTDANANVLRQFGLRPVSQYTWQETELRKLLDVTGPALAPDLAVPIRAYILHAQKVVYLSAKLGQRPQEVGHLRRVALAMRAMWLAEMELMNKMLKSISES